MDVSPIRGVDEFLCDALQDIFQIAFLSVAIFPQHQHQVSRVCQRVCPAFDGDMSARVFFGIEIP